LENPDFSSGQFNPSCGDSIALDAKLQNDRIKEIFFEGKGCVISQATASLLTELAKGKTMVELLNLDEAAMLELVGIDLGPTRLKCALLPLEALQEGIKKYQKKGSNA
jgi:nitrogen fixation NifU-like protein